MASSEDGESEVDEDLLWDDMTVNGTDSPVSGSFVPPAGAPFSALTPSIWPQDILARIQQVISTMNKFFITHAYAECSMLFSRPKMLESVPEENMMSLDLL